MSKCLQKFNPRGAPAPECNGTACSLCADPCEVASEAGQLEPAGVKRRSERWVCCGATLDVETAGLRGCANCEGENPPMLVQDFGHCGHAPQCINDGPMDDRDPFGCCRCGDRKREKDAADAAARLGATHSSTCEQRMRQARATGSRVFCSCGEGPRA
jgi:hypothetical protein